MRDASEPLPVHNLREASALLVQLRWAIPGPLTDGRATITDSHAFFVQYSKAKEENPAAS